MTWEVSRSPYEIQSFVRLDVYYRIFIHHFSKIAVPLTWLTKKTVTFCWGLEQHETFKTLRQRLCEAPILTLLEGVEDFLA